eukprot:70855_1
MANACTLLWILTIPHIYDALMTTKSPCLYCLEVCVTDGMECSVACNDDIGRICEDTLVEMSYICCADGSCCDMSGCVDDDMTFCPTTNPTIQTTNPTIPTDNPTISTDNPTIPTDNPTISTDNPTIPTDNPTIQTDNPTISTDNPTIPTDNPTIQTDNPTTQTDNPTASPTVDSNESPDSHGSDSNDISNEHSDAKTENVPKNMAAYTNLDNVNYNLKVSSDSDIFSNIFIFIF